MGVLVVLALLALHRATLVPEPVTTFPTGEAAERAWNDLDGCARNLETLRSAVEAYHARAGAYPARLQEAMASSTVPPCPAAGQDTYTASYRLTSDGRGYRVACQGRWHAGLGVPLDHPLYASDQGLVVPVTARRGPARAPRAPLEPGAEQCVTNLRNLGTAVELYAAQNDGALPRSLAQLVPSVMKVLPTCPAAGRDTYSSTYASTRKPLGYTIACGGSHHRSAGLAPDHPSISSDGGVRTGAPTPSPRAVPPSSP